MKKNLIAAVIVACLALAWNTPVSGSEVERTIVGTGACAKCLLKEKGAEACQITLISDEGDTKTTYHVTQNAVAKAFGDQLCKAGKKVRASGTVKEVGGKLELTPTKIELAGN